LHAVPYASIGVIWGQWKYEAEQQLGEKYRTENARPNFSVGNFGIIVWV